jgi:hypothetical protein
MKHEHLDKKGRPYYCGTQLCCWGRFGYLVDGYFTNPKKAALGWGTPY